MRSSRRGRSYGCASASSNDRWREAAEGVRAAPSPWESESFGELYLLAKSEASLVLRTFRTMDDARREDIALGALVEKLPEIAAADRPRAYFRTVVLNDAISWTRGDRARVAETPRTTRAYVEGPLDEEEMRAIYRLDVCGALESADERELAMLLADAEGVAREDIARAHGTTRANVDQIISRWRRKRVLGDA